MAATSKSSSSKASKSSGAGSRASAGSRPSSEIRRVADLLKQVSDPTRLQVLMLLNEKGSGNVSELCADLGISRVSRRSATIWPCSDTAA